MEGKEENIGHLFSKLEKKKQDFMGYLRRKLTFELLFSEWDKEFKGDIRETLHREMSETSHTRKKKDSDLYLPPHISSTAESGCKWSLVLINSY